MLEKSKRRHRAVKTRRAFPLHCHLASQLILAVINQLRLPLSFEPAGRGRAGSPVGPPSLLPEKVPLPQKPSE